MPPRTAPRETCHPKGDLFRKHLFCRRAFDADALAPGSSAALLHWEAPSPTGSSQSSLKSETFRPDTTDPGASNFARWMGAERTARRAPL